LLILLLLCGLAPGLWLRTRLAQPNHDQLITMASLPLPALCCQIGPFRLEAVWQLTSPNNRFGSYSGMVRIIPGRLVAFSDRGYFLDFPDPGPGNHAARIGSTIGDEQKLKDNRDVEAASYDPVSRYLWLALEGRNAISRHGADLVRQAMIVPQAMRDWPQNKGPEAMVRLRDGRFIVLSEAYADWFENSHHPALLFPGDPISSAEPTKFTFVGPKGYRPTDMAQLPDGRVLVVMRRLLWPFPVRTAARIVLADPAQISAGGLWRGQQIASLDAPLPVDNFEAITIDQAAGGTITVWLMSDDNGAISQRTLLWRMTLDPALLPARPDKQKARDHLRAPLIESRSTARLDRNIRQPASSPVHA
jgi:hypothetical protein